MDDFWPKKSKIKKNSVKSKTVSKIFIFCLIKANFCVFKLKKKLNF